MTTTRLYDNFNRLTSVSANPSGAGEPNISYGYAYNSAHQRTQATLEDGSYWVYQYDALGQVVSGKRFWSDGTPVAGQQFEYGFDDIGNRQVTRKGGNEFGVGLRTEGYTANNLNQYTVRTVPGAVDVIGEANSAATVTVNTRSTSRKGSYFRAELFTDNGGSLQYLSLTNHAVLNDDPDITNSVLGELLIPASPEVVFHDADGNLLSDGLWTNTWDHENRMIATESVPDVPVVAKRRLEFVYDYMGRRISKTVSTNSGSGWVEQYERKFVYDGWNLIAELDGSDSLVQTYIWGLDLSGSQQGAGGVGGLLMVGGEHLAAYDGNGNVVGLVGSIDGTRSAEYEYDPFGGTLRATGVASESNPFRFSTKYTDEETGLVYYGYRYYNPGTGRWLSRDPIEEEGGVNLHGFLRNDRLNQIDVLGLASPVMVPGIVPSIPSIMTANGWVNGAALQKRWFSNSAIGPQLPDTTTIKMEWVLGYARAKKVYDDIISKKLYVNDAAVAQIKKIHGSKDGVFGDFSLPVPILDKDSIQYRSVTSSASSSIDDLFAALGNFTFRVVVKGCATKGAIGITHIGIYVKDSFDFQGTQTLGYWNKATNYGGKNPFKGTKVTNADYRSYAQATGFGGDFLVFSDIKVVKLVPLEVILKP